VADQFTITWFQPSAASTTTELAKPLSPRDGMFGSSLSMDQEPPEIDEEQKLPRTARSSSADADERTQVKLDEHLPTLSKLNLDAPRHWEQPHAAKRLAWCTEGRSCHNLGRVLVLNDPSA